MDGQETTGLTSGKLTLSVVRSGMGRRLRVVASSADELSEFDGAVGTAGERSILDGSLSAANAVAVRAHVPWLQPRPLGLAMSAGVGDRLGLATPGHVRAFRKFGSGIVPVFAQQSIREMDRLGRTPQEVLDDATFGALEAGWDRQVGADADHLKTTQDIDRCLAAGFTSFTIDPGEHVRVVDESFVGDLSDVAWGALEDNESSMLRRYEAGTFDLGNFSLNLGVEELRRAAYKYAGAVAHTVEMYRHLMARAEYPVEVEVAIDETESPTTIAEHVYMATEMRRLDVKWVSFAPRYIGGFEKGVEYIGDTGALANSLSQHFAVATALGPYKISLHSGSDKFSIYALAADATEGMIHLKTSGTSYLVALGVAAQCAPSLFREIYDVSRDAYQGARDSYQVSADRDRTPLSRDVADGDLGTLVTNFDSRQILHVGYGAVLTLRDQGGNRWLDDELHSLLIAERERYEEALEDHIGRHLAPLKGASRHK
jgi:hypothetical protein